MTGFASEAEMVACWLDELQTNMKVWRGPKWTIYPETADWDILLVNEHGEQVGLEAKLLLNTKVVSQALDGQHRFWRAEGPDWRGVLVPSGKVQACLGSICAAIGIGIVTAIPKSNRSFIRGMSLPGGVDYGGNWPNWHPMERCKLPEYVPDVEAGKPSPLKLSPWKIQAIKLMILLDRNGAVTRKDMKALDVSPSRWTDLWHGFLERTPGGYVRCGRTPDFRKQHPRVYAEIEADFDKWWPPK